MGILKVTFFVSARQKVIWLGISGLTSNLMSWVCEGYTSISEIETFDSNVKLKAFNDKKTFKTSKFDTCLCHVLPLYYEVKWYFSTS